MNLSPAVATAILNHYFHASQLALPAAIYVALFTTDGGDPNGRIEVSGGAYARQRLFTDGATAPYATAVANHADGKFVENNAEIAFPEATADWGDVTAVGIVDAVTGGNLLLIGDLVQAEPVLTGRVFRFKAGDLDLIVEASDLTVTLNP